MIYFLTSTGSSSTKSPAKDTGFTYPDEETTKSLSLHIYAFLIHAINDIAPSPLPVDERPEPFLYWENGLDATTTLIKRYVFVVVTCVIFLLLCAKIYYPMIPKTYLFISVVALPIPETYLSVPIWPHLI